ncbi:F-box/kelch-repeat protein At5g42350 [Arachis duranensis]|uniref:F-box/kelch-repeat protein At5g42350 n=1 Tax=Arachis duranensis TaxID=130453 RepID=A0A6P4BZK8_ARADU|nr:F-box/kelch-repeat protein At5g42350 [Arachis duranensis]XP_015934074.1 F-box/kelch-repeat protein At5g42350 [Arachis duranensis]XP_052108775.1 F-box/kelch-repeat protein At5g42350 [Arachis duranensis]
MFSEGLGADESLCQDVQSLSVSKRLVRSVSQKLRKKNNRSAGEEDDDLKGVALRCLTLYSRGGGCKVGADTSDEFSDSNGRRRSSASEEGRGYKPICGPEETAVDCFSYGVRDIFWRRHSRKNSEIEELAANTRMHIFLPDDVLEMCLVRLPLTSLMNARLVCKKWRALTTTPRFLQMRREGSYQNPWLFLFGAVKDGFCSGEIHALDVSMNQWHRIDAEYLRGRFLFSVASIQDDIFIVGGCSSLTSFGRVDRSSFKTHKGVVVFSPLTKSWRKIPSMKYGRSVPILGVSEVSSDFPTCQGHQSRQDRRPRSRIGGVSDVYEDPHKLSMRRHCRSSFNESEASSVTSRRTYKFLRQKSDHSSSKGSRRVLLIAVGGLGSWDEPLDSGEIYDSVSNKWTEIQRLPFDFGVACSGIVCGKMFYVYSETDKLAAYDVERGFWISIQTSPFPPRVLEYYPKLVSSDGRLFMLSVSWCEGDGQIGRRNKAVRKLWELDLMYLTWTEVSVHPDAPMDWNAVFVADKSLIFGIEMFKIFGQVLDFFTVCDVSDMARWHHISRNHVTHELDASSCLTKTVAVLHL